MIYLDSSALVKLAIDEVETVALRHWLDRRKDQPRVTSQIAFVEVPRAVQRTTPTAMLAAYKTVAYTRQVALTRHLFEMAAALPPATLRSLDAIHLASALRIRHEITAFVAYDKPLTDAAEAAGLPVTAPA